MTIGATVRTFAIGAIFLVPLSAVHAAIVIVEDFTDVAWIGVEGVASHQIGIIKLSTDDPDGMSFNDVDGAPGCGNGGADLGTTGLDCFGDGIGIDDDEISEGGAADVKGQSLEIEFDKAVNILSIDLLDLFVKETGTVNRGGSYGVEGEVAIIEWGGVEHEFHANGDDNFPGGYWAINIADAGLTMAGITSFTLTGFSDDFSDFSLARIKYEMSPVPVPAAFWMFGTALIGFVAMSRRTKV